MSRRRPFIPQRKPIFVGCEGESERSYIALLGRLAEQNGLAVHLDPIVLQPGGGDSLALIERAAQRLAEKKRKRGSPYNANFVLLDRDRHGQNQARDARLLVVAADSDLRLIWQRPCHEALLLRHLEDCATLRPPSTALALDQLSQSWPEYRKASDSGLLARRLDLPAIARAAEVEPELASLLTTIGLI